MPRYDFKCRECGKTQEEDRSISERDESGKCWKCGGVTDHIVTFNGMFKNLSTPGSALSKNKETKP